MTKTILTRTGSVWLIVLVAFSVECTLLLSFGAAEARDLISTRSAGMGGARVAVLDPANGGLNPAVLYPGVSACLQFGGLFSEDWDFLQGFLYEPDSGLGAGSVTWYREERHCVDNEYVLKQIAYNWASKIDRKTLFGIGFKWDDCDSLKGERLSFDSLGIDLGALLLWQDKAAVGFSVENLWRTSRLSNAFDTGWSVGVSFSPVTDALIVLDVVERDDFQVRLGGEYWVKSQTAVRLGFAKGLGRTEIEVWTAGFGYKGNRWSIDYVVRTDKESITHGCALGFQL